MVCLFVPIGSLFAFGIISMVVKVVQPLSSIQLLWPHGLQHARPPCPPLSPRVCSNSCPLSQWCHPTISSSFTHFSCPQSFPATGSFPMSQLFASGGQSIGASASAQSFHWIFRVDFLSHWLVWSPAHRVAKSQRQLSDWTTKTTLLTEALL